MDILSYVDCFCCNNNIKYSICGGTLIGAIRHGGYIPWDDDIDIMMTRENYDRFLDLLIGQKSFYQAHSLSKSIGCILPIAKVSDARTIMKTAGIPDFVGVNIDVFPIDYISNDYNAQKEIMRKERFLYNNFKYSAQKWINDRPFVNNVVVMCNNITCRIFLSRYNIASKMDYIAREAGKCKTSTRASMVRGYGEKEILPAKTFDSYYEINLEDRVKSNQS